MGKKKGKKQSSVSEEKPQGSTGKPPTPSEPVLSHSEPQLQLQEAAFPSLSTDSSRGRGRGSKAWGRGHSEEPPPPGFLPVGKKLPSPKSVGSSGDSEFPLLSGHPVETRQPHGGGSRDRGRGRGGIPSPTVNLLSPTLPTSAEPDRPDGGAGGDNKPKLPQQRGWQELREPQVLPSQPQSQSQQPISETEQSGLSFHPQQSKKKQKHQKKQQSSEPLAGEIKERPSSSSISCVTSQESSASVHVKQMNPHISSPSPLRMVANEPKFQTARPEQIQQQQPEIVEITKKMARMSVPYSAIPQRKSKGEVVGKKGRPIPLEVNHLALSLKNPNMIAIHYDVSFKPETPRRLFRPAMQAFQKLMYPENFPAFDGRKNLYSRGYLPGGLVLVNTVNVRNDEKQDVKEFEITVKFAAKVDMSPLINYMNRGSSTNPPQEVLQAIDIVLRSPAAMRFVPVGRSFFTAPRDGKTTIDLGDGLELWYGFYQSAILGWKPFLNVDVAHKGFPKADNLIKVIMDLTGLQERDLQRELESRSRDTFHRFISGLKIEYEIPKQPQTKRTFKVNKVMGSSVRERFDYEKDDKKYQIAVGEYFEKYKGYKMIFPNMPCLHVGAPQKNIYVPVELCRVARGQALLRKLNEKQTATMVRNAAQPADVRKNRILDAIKMADFNKNPSVQEFGITVSDRFTAITGRILEPPTLKYSTVEVLPEKGVWRSRQFLVSQSLRHWSILNCDERTKGNLLMKLAEDLVKIGREHGCVINPHPAIKEINKRSYMIKREDIADKMLQCKKENNDLVMVIIPDSGDVYGKVKQAAELDVGILTQCVKASTVFKKLSPPTVINILLKINSKLNGINHTIGGLQRPMVLRRPIMIVGADVTHPSPDQTHIPSVAAVAASHDPKAFQYNMMWRLQPPRTEIIVDLENIMKGQLLFFYKRTTFKPERLFFYRDGVSEGQFLEVLNKELQAIRRACCALESDYKPKITFLVVQKRHHTRFFPTRREDEDGKNRNVPAGTIVDTTITHPTEFDFYLVSHASIQGTSRPTKYHLLWDDNEMDEDELEALTYYLCHLFSRCTRSVSYPAPTYYAHLAAFRARVYLEGNDKINLSKLPMEQDRRKIRSQIVDKSPMFFV